MLLYGISFPDMQNNEISELYYRCSGNVLIKQDIMEIQNGEVSFDTYFNAFSSSKFYEYTELRGIIFKLSVKGRGVLKIVSRSKEHTLEIARKEFSCEDFLEISVKCALSEKTGAILYPVIESFGECSVCGMGFYSEIEGYNIAPVIVICTFHREEYVYRNLKKFAKSRLNIPVLLVDNGQSIDTNKIEYPYCKVFPNRNYGGSGGFTRGMIEALRDGSFTHIILMDDDITIDCTAIQKTLAFIRFLKDSNKKIGIAGGMLERQTPYKQFEASARWKNGKLEHLNHGLDLRDINTLLDNESECLGNYGAWWYLCMSVSALQSGLPLPFFIKTDDIEFGLRTLDKVLVLNGIGLWHDSFDGKFSYYLEYYIKRNELVCNAIHEKYALKLALKKLFFGLGKCLVSYNYRSVKYITKAFDDYLKGPDFFLNTDEEQLNSKLREDMEKPDAVTSPPEVTSVKDKKLLRILTLNGYLIPSCFLKRNTKTIPWSMGKPKDYFGYKNIVEYDFSGNRGVCRTMKKRWLFIGAGLLIKYTVRLIIENKKAVSEYKNRIGEITSAKFWCDHLGVEEIKVV